MSQSVTGVRVNRKKLTGRRNNPSQGVCERGSALLQGFGRRLAVLLPILLITVGCLPLHLYRFSFLYGDRFSGY